jgi:hypothetical protein
MSKRDLTQPGGVTSGQAKSTWDRREFLPAASQAIEDGVLIDMIGEGTRHPLPRCPAAGRLGAMRRGSGRCRLPG